MFHAENSSCDLLISRIYTHRAIDWGTTGLVSSIWHRAAGQQKFRQVEPGAKIIGNWANLSVRKPVSLTKRVTARYYIRRFSGHASQHFPSEICSDFSTLVSMWWCTGSTRPLDAGLFSRWSASSIIYGFWATGQTLKYTGKQTRMHTSSRKLMSAFWEIRTSINPIGALHSLFSMSRRCSAYRGPPSNSTG